MISTACLTIDTGDALHVVALEASVDPHAVERYLIALEAAIWPCMFSVWTGAECIDADDAEEAVYLVDRCLREARDRAELVEAA